MLLLRRQLTNRTTRLLLAALFLGGLSLRILPLDPFHAMSVVAQSASTPTPAIEGWITDLVSSEPIAEAQVTLESSITGAVQSTSQADGYFSFSTSQVGPADTATSSTGKPVTIRVNATGHTPWSIKNANYYKGDTLRLYPRLDKVGKAATSHTAHYRLSNALVQQMQAGLAPAPLTMAGLRSMSGNSSNAAPVSSNFSAAPAAMPASVRVYRTDTGTVEVVPFREYLKHVLPCEWIPTWGTASLRAGAMAVKSYAWFWVSRGGKQVALGADVKDNTEDQVYDPNISYSSTDAAVDATYQYSMTMSGNLFQAQYCAGSYMADPSGDCPWGGPYMTQWGSSWYADHGRTWSWILQFYYPGVFISPTPPGGSYDGTPPPTSTSKPAPTASQSTVNFSVGQGAPDPQVYKSAYERNGGAQALGKPTGSVHWWMTYVSENNVQAQALSGRDGKGNTWLVYDVLKSSSLGVQTAYVLSGPLARAYSTHDPVGPEWVGAPTSDAYQAAKGTGTPTRQGFSKGTLLVAGSNVQFDPWPQSFPNWKAEWFVGHAATRGQDPLPFDLPGAPALVSDAVSPDLQYDGQATSAAQYGVGKNDWAVQFTRNVQVNAGNYNFTLDADSGARLWIDNVLAVNGWQWTSPSHATYNADLEAGAHQVRVQYFSLSSRAQLSYKMLAQSAAAAVPTLVPTAVPTQQSIPTATVAPEQATPPVTTSQLRVRVTWLGRSASPDDSWAQPLTLQLSMPDTASIIGTYKGTTDRNGVAFYSDIPVGKYNVHVKGPHSLQSARAGISLANGVVTDLDMKVQVEGDINGDNCVTVDDYTLVQAQLGLKKGMPDFQPIADLNNDGEVSIADVSLLRSGFDKCGDISADSSFTTMSSDSSPSLSQTLAPWLAPERLQHNLSMSLVAGAKSTKVGQIADVQVVADTGQQPVDGSAFLLKYDPAVLAPVDFDGNPAGGALPGIALPSVMGNWLDARGGTIGYSAGMLQGAPPQGKVVVAKLRFKVLILPASAHTSLVFSPAPSGLMQITNGGVNLLGKAIDGVLTITP